MLWFQGAIPAAIASAKRSGAVFVVFVAGDDEQSTQMAASWEDEKVSEASSNSFVAIKIDTKSEACLQFSQIYPVVCVPSSFFIGDSGIPLEVIAGSVSADELVTRIHKVRQMHSLKGETSEANGSQSESSLSTPSTSFEPNNTSENTQSRNVELCEASPTSDTATGGEKSDHATSSQEPRGCSNPRPSEDLTVKVERLTKKLEERREEKRKEEEQREIKKEIERRKTGKEMLDYKRKQEEELTKRMLEERNREKAEDRAARERIKQQIALDRAERAARFAKTKEEVEAAKAAALLVKQAEMEVKRDASARERSTVARIQFRLPDGSYFTNQFPSDAPLEEARQFAAQTVGNTYGNFSLATMFPRREFTKEDFKKEGKIYRLRTQDDGEDENNTWNGNSTQQM
uniref:UBX domain-containing protein 4 n=1 Tax=Myotis myotis TaxID=51298 RepID=A0A7J7WKA6_MYOMY|nr:UBX domain protein 4 [Myotis myotis]